MEPELTSFWRHGAVSSGNHEGLYEISWWFWDILVWTKLVRSSDWIQNWAASAARMHHWDSWVLPRAAQPTVPLCWACFLVSFQPDLNCPHMALRPKAPPVPLYGSSAVFLHATAAVFGSSPQIKNSLLGRWASIWKKWNMWQRFHTQGKASSNWTPLIIHSVQGGWMDVRKVTQWRFGILFNISWTRMTWAGTRDPSERGEWATLWIQRSARLSGSRSPADSTPGQPDEDDRD